MDWRRRCITQFITLASAAAYWSLVGEEQQSKSGGRPPAIIRQRRSVDEVYQSLGARFFRRAYLWATTRGLVVEVEMSYKLQKKKVRGWRELHKSNLRSWKMGVSRSPR
jgi:hypothetical protein